MIKLFPTFSCLSLVLSVALVTGDSAQADVKLPGFFGDHMVLQQNAKIRVWGWAEPGESVAVTLGSDRAETKTDSSGRWQVELPPREATSDAVALRVQGNNTIELQDVLIGEVWLCSGQSNMEWTVRQSTNAAGEIAAANHPLIRHIKFAHRPSTVPLDDIQSQWQICSPETVANFTAVGYFMARHLQQELDVPIGLINSSWGGTRVEPWTPPVGFKQVEALGDIYQSVMGRTPGTDAYRARLSKHIRATEEWLASAKGAFDSQQPLDASPAFPDELKPFRSHQDPTMLYNGMIHAIVGFPIRGAIWYQGESNHTEGMLYFEKKKALINGWRKLWGQGDFPFYYVQIAPFQYGSEDPTILARFWEAQAAVQQIAKTGMVVINDITTLNDIHPPNKQDVGHRLALLALKNDYGRSEVVANSPEMDSFEVTGNRLTITFRNTGGGLKTRDGAAPTHFELIGPGSRGFQPATAKIDGDTVTLTSDAVNEPTAFRFAWHKLAEPNLVGATGLPVGACRAGEEPDLASTLSIEDDYQLVYDLDLSKLGREIRYDVDRSSEVTSFDRVGYLLELDSNSGSNRTVFVSLSAFTDDATKIGIPTAASQSHFQQPVELMDVFSNVNSLATGNGIKTGNIEFWPNNYGARNSAGVRGASNNIYDFGDEPAEPRDGYGSMQIHNHGTGETILAINHWSQGGAADIGIGNSSSEHKDWTFTGSGGNYQKKRLRIYVRPTKP